MHNFAPIDGVGTAPPFIQATFLLLGLPSIGLAFRGRGNVRSKVHVPLVEGRNHSIILYSTLIGFSFFGLYIGGVVSLAGARASSNEAMVPLDAKPCETTSNIPAGAGGPLQVTT